VLATSPSVQPRLMKLLPFALGGLLLVLTACENREARLLAGMSASEKASFLALGRYYDCTNNFVRKAKKANRRPSDDELRLWGYKCPSELERAAETVDDYWMSDNYKRRDDPAAYSAIRSVRIAFHKDELAGAHAYCEFRECVRTD